MANKRISQLPYVGNTGYTSNDIMPIVNYDVLTGTTKHTPLLDLKTFILSGITTGSTQLYEVGTGTDSTQRIGVNADASGKYSVVSGGYYNTASCNYSTVSGGYRNTASSYYSTVAGGCGSTASACYSTIGGGENNTITTNSDYSTISGGEDHLIDGCDSTIGGGENNTIVAIYSTISGGYYNTITNNCSTISGGYNNIINDRFSFIGGGYNNTSSGYYGCNFIGGGRRNTISGNYTTISGGYQNTSSGGYSSVISGGRCNTTSASYGTISGGYNNIGIGQMPTIGGGRYNTVSGHYATIGGGYYNTAIGCCSFIGGGILNTADGSNIFIGGGSSNTASSYNTVVVGGTLNTVNNTHGTILGGSGNTINHDYSSAIGLGVTSVSACTFHTNYLALQNTPEINYTSSDILVRDASTGVVKQRPIPSLAYGLFSQTGTSATVTATVAETSIIGSGTGTLSVPANGFNVGDSFRVIIGGHASFDGTDTLTVRVKSNSTVLASTGAINLANATGQHWIMTVDFTVRTLGGAGVASIVSLGHFSYIANASTSFEGSDFSVVESTNFNTTVSNTLDITVQFSSTSATNSMYSELFTLTKTY